MGDRVLTYEDGYREGRAAQTARPQQVERCGPRGLGDRVRLFNSNGFDVTAIVATDDGTFLLIATARAT